MRSSYDSPHDWRRLLRIALGELFDFSVYSSGHRIGAVRILKVWQGTKEFNDWAQSLPPEDAAKLFAILHE